MQALSCCMRDFDVAMKSLVVAAAADLLPQIGIREPVTEWLNLELAASKRRADLIGRLASGRLIHIELQLHNDKWMCRRMLDYAVRIYDKTGQFPHQFVLYFGAAKMRMPNHISGPGLAFQYTLLDMRRLNPEALLQSGLPESNILAILTDSADRELSSTS